MVFRKRLLSSSVALALIGTAVPAFAQDEGVIEEIIVQGGIRGSLKASMDIKRDSMGCLLYTSPSPRDRTRSRMPSSA